MLNKLNSDLYTWLIWQRTSRKRTHKTMISNYLNQNRLKKSILQYYYRFYFQSVNSIDCMKQAEFGLVYMVK